jgi:signal transduction histidine kinase/ligand-binding sensor domain-containing protein
LLKIFQKSTLFKENKMKKNKTNDFQKNDDKGLGIITTFIFSALIFSVTLIAQTNNDINFKHISTSQGLSQGTASCIIQDKHGFMWFGTQDGLKRYDGHEFNLYTYDFNKPDTLSHSLVISICMDQSGILWAGTLGGGLNKFDPQTEKFTNHRGNKNFEPLKNMNIRAIHIDKQGILWIGTDEGLYKSNPDRSKFHPYNNCTSSHGGVIKKVKTIYGDKEDTTWVGCDDGLYKCKSGEEYFTHYSIEPDAPFKNEVNAICQDQPGELWIGTTGGLYKFDRKAGKFTTYTKHLKGKQIRKIYKDKDGILWIGTRGEGLNRFDVEKEIFSNHKNIPNDLTSLSNNNVTDIYQDSSGLIWIGTIGGGINKFDPVGKKFTLYKNIPGDSTSLNNNEVRGIGEDKNGVIWVGTRGGGINKFDPVSKKFTHYLIEDRISQNPRRNDINVTHSDHFGTLWLGTFGGGLYQFVPVEEKFYPYESNFIGNGAQILSIYEDKEGFLWIGALDGGLVKLGKDKERKELKNYKNIPKNSNSLSSNNVYAIFEDHSGILWIGTGGGGLNKFIKKKEQFTRYHPEQGCPNCISHNFVSSIYEDSSGILWIGTLGGFNKLDRGKDKFITFTTREGLPNNVIYDILEDKNGNLWLSTNRGLSKFNPKTGESRNYTISDGLQGYEFNRGAACYSKKTGMMFFGGFNGFNVFDPGKIVDISSPPPIVITSFKKLNKNVSLKTSFLETRELRLSYNDNSISFGFAVLSFLEPENNKYAYKLEPIHKDWIQLGNKHDVDLTNLDPGKYTFRVKGADKHGTWSEQGKSIRITVTPPFWATWWFQTLIVLALLSSVVIFIKIRIRVFETQKRKLQELVEERTEEINRQKEELKKANALLKQEIDLREEAERQEKLRQEELIRADRMISLGRLVSGVAHEINNPVSIIKINSAIFHRVWHSVGMVLDEYNERNRDFSIDGLPYNEAKNKLEELITGLTENSQRIEKIINDLRDFSRPGDPLIMKPTDINKGIQSSVNLANNMLKKATTQFSLNLAENLPLIQGNFQKLEQVFINLIQNACQALPDKNRGIHISTDYKKDKDHIVITVKDEGVGIDNKVLGYITDPFFTTKRDQGGTGLGLSISLQIIREHNGSMNFESEVGKGTTVTVRLPVNGKY